MIPAQAEEFMAKRMGATVHTVPATHTRPWYRTPKRWLISSLWPPSSSGSTSFEKRLEIATVTRVDYVHLRSCRNPDVVRSDYLGIRHFGHEIDALEPKLLLRDALKHREVSTRQTTRWDNLSLPRGERVIPSIFKRIRHIP